MREKIEAKDDKVKYVYDKILGMMDGFNAPENMPRFVRAEYQEETKKQLDMVIKAFGKIYNKSYVFLSNMERFEYRQTLSKLKDNQEKEQ